MEEAVGSLRPATETILKVDELLLKTIKEYSNRNIQSYTRRYSENRRIVKILKDFNEIFNFQFSIFK